MSKHLATSQALELLESLKATVRDFTARATKLADDYKLKVNRERHRRNTSTEDFAKDLNTQLGDTDSAFETARANRLANFEKRKVRIGKAYQGSKEQLLKRVEDQVGARKYELQKKMLQSERDREAGLTASNSKIQQLKADLATELTSLAALEGAAQKSFHGYGKFLQLFQRSYERADADLSPDENQLLANLRDLIAKADGQLRHFRRFFLLHLFRYWAVWLVLALGVFGLVPLAPRLGISNFSYRTAALAAAALFILALILRFLLEKLAEPMVTTLSRTLATARRLHDACLEKAETHHRDEVERLKDQFVTTTQWADQQLKKAMADAAQQRVASRMRSDEKTVAITARHEQLHHARLARFEQQHKDSIANLKRAAEANKKQFLESSQNLERSFETTFQNDWRILETEWTEKLRPLYASIDAANQDAQKTFPPWPAPGWEKWAPPTRFAAAAKFAELKVNVDKLAGLAPNDKHPDLPGPSQLSIPLSLIYPNEGAILFETTDSGRDQAVGALNNIILRLLSVAPPGKLNFTILDPVGLGQGFAGVMHLADYEEQIINNRIWTQTAQIEEKLRDLNEHMEKVIQMYLRNEYQTIAEYNEQAGVIAEKYYFLVVADFPANFSDTAARRLLSIAASGARCGVYTLIHWDRRQPLPPDFSPDELRKTSVCLTAKGLDFILGGKFIPGATLALDDPPTPEKATEFTHQVGRSSRDSSRVEVPFEHVAPAEKDVWTEDTTSELRVPIGRTGATKLQYLAIGKGTCQHGLIAGKTGSGKSTLFHVIITNLALWCSPEQVEFYLVDFKKGVEFKCYAARHLPHARVVAIESDREFGLSVLQRVDDELKRRGDMFRKLGVQDIAGYKRAGGKEAIPRTLLMVDEFQEFFVEDDKVAQSASLLLDRIVRQGRAFGIHVLLGSQTLGGAYTVARTTLGQMVIRIALQCNEADAYMIMDDTNPAPRLLSRPGEGIYNDTAGSVEGNSPFQTVWLPDEVRDSYLARVRARADQDGKQYPGPIVFEGNAPADVRENLVLRGLLQSPALKPTPAARIWLGAPNSIKGPTEVVFQRQSGNNLIIVGQREEAMLAILSVALVSLASQFPSGTVRFIVCDSTPSGSPQRDFLERVVNSLPHPVTMARQGDLGDIMKTLVDDMKQRTDDEHSAEAPATFLFINGLQKYNKLRYEEDFTFSASDSDAPPNPGALLNTLLAEGARLGFHVIASVDSYNNVNRVLSRKAFSEFELRVLFQMSANDSASLIDNPKASTLGMHRALYYNQQEGYLETFRPYALPENEWIEQVEAKLKRSFGATEQRVTP